MKESAQARRKRVVVKIFASIDAIVGIPEETKAVMKRNIAEIMSSTCTFCDGSGHHARLCGSMKNIDDCFKRLPA